MPIKPADARAIRMMEMYRAGLTLEKIGQSYGLTRERVRQVIRKYGCTRDSGGIAHRAKVGRAAALAVRDQRYIAKHGTTFAEYKAIRKAGGVIRYLYQRRSANSRAIPWRLTLRQWWDLWQESGHWADRGRGAGQYCMARIADKGAYEFGNVYITTGRENAQEWVRTRRKASPYGPGVYCMYPGRARAFLARVGKTNLGYYATAQEATAARTAAMAD